MVNDAPHLLIVDDEVDLRQTLNCLLAIEGFQVSEAADGAEALAVLDRGLRPDLLLLDQRMPGLSGSQTLEAVRARGLMMPAILVSAASDGAEIASRHRFHAFVPKPFSAEQLLEHVRALLPDPASR
jgi:DNA-binding NtrC family response regulator